MGPGGELAVEMAVPGDDESWVVVDAACSRDGGGNWWWRCGSACQRR